jgi:hypothetical protein
MAANSRFANVCKEILETLIENSIPARVEASQCVYTMISVLRRYRFASIV